MTNKDNEIDNDCNYSLRWLSSFLLRGLQNSSTPPLDWRTLENFAVSLRLDKHFCALVKPHNKSVEQCH